MRRLLIVALCQIVVGLPPQNLCRSPDCLYFANFIKDKLNTSINPCDDFYEFACGGLNKDVLNGGETWTPKMDMETEILDDVIKMLEDDSNPSGTTGAFRKFQKMYRNCMDLEAIERNGVGAILSRLEASGGWPMMMAPDNWTAGEVSLSRILGYHIDQLGLWPIFYVNVQTEYQPEYAKRLTIEHNDYTPFDKSVIHYKLYEPEVAQYDKLIMDTVKIFANATGNVVNIADLLKDIDQMMTFVTKFKNIEVQLEYESPNDEDEEEMYSLMKIGDFQKLYDSMSKTNRSKISWFQVLTAAVNYSGMILLEESLVSVNKESIRRLVNVLDTTPTRAIVNYIQWHFLYSILSAGPQGLRNIAVEIALLEGTPRKDRKYTCARQIVSDHAVGHQYVKTHLSAYTITQVENVISAVKSSFDRLFETTTSLPRGERRSARNKLKEMISLVGYPKWFATAGEMDRFHEKLIVNDNYADNVIARCRFHYSLDIQGLGKPQDPEEALTSSSRYVLENEADYDKWANTLALPAGLLRRPVFASDVPSFLTYGVLGRIVGHMINRGFDLEDLKEKIPETTREKEDCFAYQYFGRAIYEDENGTLSMDVGRSLAEHINEFYGVKTAYGAYERGKTGDQARLPGLENYTGDQLFFMAHASFSCEAMTRRYLKHKATTADRPIAEFRINGAVSNMKEFSDAFGCSANSQMNPKEKCGIW